MTGLLTDRHLVGSAILSSDRLPIAGLLTVNDSWSTPPGGAE